MRTLLGALLLFGSGVVVGTMGSDDTLLQEAQQKATQAYDQGVADATRQFQGVAVQVGYAVWQPSDNPREPARFVWKQQLLENLAEVEDALYLVPAVWQPDPSRPPQRVMLPVSKLPGDFPSMMLPTAG